MKAYRRQVPFPTESEWDRFWGYVRNYGKDGCWPWAGGRFSHGYGLFVMREQNWAAHRVAYVWTYGEPPDGKDLDHTCHDPDECAGGPTCPHRLCVNPDHLAPATTRENVLRGGGITAKLAVATHCIRGHVFTPENTYIDKAGARQCRTCMRARSNAYREANHEQVLERRRAAREHVVHESRPCKICGVDFTPIRSTATQCPECRNSPNPVRRAYMRDYMRSRRKEGKDA